MLIKGAAVTVIYNKINEIKKAYYNNTSIFKELYYDATTLAVPDEAPLELPRFIIKTRDNQADLSVTPVGATFSLRCDEVLDKDWIQCEKYLNKHMAPVFDFLNIFTNDEYNYIGAVAVVLYDDIKDNVTEKISDKLLKTTNFKQPYDIGIKYTFVEEDKYFVNIKLQNDRLFKTGLDNTIAGDFSRENQISETLGIVVDVNDRFGFFNNVNYKSNHQNLQFVLRKVANILNNKITCLVEKGEY